MAYDQGYYQAPQRPYNGRAAQPPAQAYGQGPPPQQYPPQGQYDPYGQDDYGHNDYGNDYGQGYDDQYQQPGYGGGVGSRRPQPPQNQGYRTQQGYYDNGGARGGGDPRSQRSAARGGGANYGRPPTADSRGGGGGRGNGNGAPMNGGGGRPPPLVRPGNSDPGCEYLRFTISFRADLWSLKHGDRSLLPSSPHKELLGTIRFQAFQE
jgi:hypothetical protein